MSVSKIVPSFAFDKYGDDILLINDQGGFYSLSGSMRCRFGPLHTTAGIQINASAILCTAPPHPAGSVNVYLSTNGIDYLNTFKTLTYLISPELINMSPKYGSSRGSSNSGQTVDITVTNIPITNIPITSTNAIPLYGESFNVKCWFGDISSHGIVINSTNIGCPIPAHSLGSVALGLEWPSAISSRRIFYMKDISAMFTYYALPHVSRSRPSEGTAAGGTSILIHGSNFRSSTHLSCRFTTISTSNNGESKIPSDVLARWINASAIECVSPAVVKSSQIRAYVELSVTNDGDYYSSPALKFKYLPRLQLLSVYPNSGSSDGGTSVIILRHFLLLLFVQ
jgi:hypothetical protein